MGRSVKSLSVNFKSFQPFCTDVGLRRNDHSKPKEVKQLLPSEKKFAVRTKQLTHASHTVITIFPAIEKSVRY